jgi:hypothetical protein
MQDFGTRTGLVQVDGRLYGVVRGGTHWVAGTVITALLGTGRIEDFGTCGGTSVQGTMKTVGDFGEMIGTTVLGNSVK